jgi:hypothetical protein
VKGEDEVLPAVAAKGAVRFGLALEFPSNAKQGGKQTLGLDGRPLVHATSGMEMLISTGRGWCGL